MSGQTNIGNAIANVITNEPRSANLEPGLLSVFRLITGVYLAFVIAGMSVGFVFAGRQPHGGTVWIIAWLTILLGYLSWNGLQVRLGSAYLPIGLAIATLSPLVERAFVLNNLSQLTKSVEIDYVIMGTGWQLVLVLFLPLILIAWQYRLREVAIFCFGTTVIEIVLIRIIWNPGADEALAALGTTVSRLLLFLVIGYVITRMVAAQREQRRMLSEVNERLVHHAATVEQLGVSHERNRLARELHDTLAHTLSSLAIQLEAVDSVWDVAPDQARELLAKARANARSGLTETRRALQALRASPLEDLGLALAVRNLAETAAVRSGLALQTDFSEEIDSLSPALEQGIYRIAQEALANAVKHANAHQLTVVLGQNDSQIWLQVTDDGQGFDPGNGGISADGEQGNGDEHYGLRGLRERAKLIDGRLEITSAPGQGTSIQLVAPLS